DTAVTSAKANGAGIELFSMPTQVASNKTALAWGIRKAGRYSIELIYTIDGSGDESGSIAIPWTEMPGAKVAVSLPRTGIAPVITPSTGASVSEQSDATSVSAQVPLTDRIYLNWNPVQQTPYTISRAVYTGGMVEKRIDWSGEFSVELFRDQAATLDLFPA